MSFPRYPKYKDSGVEWPGQVPAHWDVKTVGHVADLMVGFPFPSEGFGTDPAAGLPLVRGDNVTEGRLRWAERARFWPESSPFDERYLLETGDIVIQMDGSKVGRNWALIRADDLPALLVQRVTRVRAIGALPEFLYFLFANEIFISYVDKAKTDPAVPHITMKDIAGYPIPLPPSLEQHGIRAFLVGETERIDALVAEQRRLIELLKEKRQAVISHAVTKGLNPDAPMKPSGIEWLGDVPAHWRCGVLSRIASRVVVGIAEAATHAYADHGVAILRSTNIRPGRLTGDVLFVDPAFAEDRGSKRLAAGDLVTVRTGNAGVTAVVPAELDGCHCFTMLVTTLTSVALSSYYCYWMNSKPAQTYFALEGWGTAQVNISVPILKFLPVPIPPRDEQEAIVTFLDRKLAALDALAVQAERAIELLQERRAALISAAVTGQIDVRGLVPAEAGA